MRAHLPLAAVATLVVSATAGCTAPLNEPETDAPVDSLLRGLTDRQRMLHPSREDAVVHIPAPWPHWHTCSKRDIGLHPRETGRFAATVMTTTHVLRGDPAAEQRRLVEALRDGGFTTPRRIDDEDGNGDDDTGRTEEQGDGADGQWVRDPTGLGGGESLVFSATRPDHALATLHRQGPVMSVTLTAPCAAPPDSAPQPPPARTAPSTARSADARAEMSAIWTALRIRAGDVTRPSKPFPGDSIILATPPNGSTVHDDGWWAAPCGTGTALAAQLTAETDGVDFYRDRRLDRLARDQEGPTRYERPRVGDAIPEWRLTTRRSGGTAWDIQAATTGRPGATDRDEVGRRYTIRMTTC